MTRPSRTRPAEKWGGGGGAEMRPVAARPGEPCRENREETGAGVSAEGMGGVQCATAALGRTEFCLRGGGQRAMVCLLSRGTQTPTGERRVGPTSRIRRAGREWSVRLPRPNVGRSVCDWLRLGFDIAARGLRPSGIRRRCEFPVPSGARRLGPPQHHSVPAAPPR